MDISTSVMIVGFRLDSVTYLTCCHLVAPVNHRRFIIGLVDSHHRCEIDDAAVAEIFP